jgi:hypothetical protein
MDDCQDEIAVGGVWQLPAHDDAEQRETYVYGVIDPNNDDCAWIDFDTSGTKLDAARCADSMAERFAEEAREDAAKDRAEQRAAEIKEEIADIVQGVRDLARELRAGCDKLTGMEKVRAVLRQSIVDARKDVAKLRRELIELEG